MLFSETIALFFSNSFSQTFLKDLYIYNDNAILVQ